MTHLPAESLVEQEQGGCTPQAAPLMQTGHPEGILASLLTPAWLLGAARERDLLRRRELSWVLPRTQFQVIMQTTGARQPHLESRFPVPSGASPSLL